MIFKNTLKNIDYLYIPENSIIKPNLYLHIKKYKLLDPNDTEFMQIKAELDELAKSDQRFSYVSAEPLFHSMLLNSTDEVEKIKNSLLSLKEHQFISEDCYNEIIKYLNQEKKSGYFDFLKSGGLFFRREKITNPNKIDEKQTEHLIQLVKELTDQCEKTIFPYHFMEKDNPKKYLMAIEKCLKEGADPKQITNKQLKLMYDETLHDLNEWWRFDMLRGCDFGNSKEYIEEKAIPDYLDEYQLLYNISEFIGLELPNYNSQKNYFKRF